jgi:hypothetical protein
MSPFFSFVIHVVAKRKAGATHLSHSNRPKLSSPSPKEFTGLTPNSETTVEEPASRIGATAQTSD